MTEDPRVQSGSNNGASAKDREPAGNATQFFSESSNLTEVAQTLASHGGGAVSVELALDLVLNEVIEQARAATGASGAAAALFRDGELTCRATAGENAPDLGVRVDATSSLAGTCMSTGEIQQCRDTETDSRVNAEACRRLGVRSMLIAPLVDHNQTIGIIQVFSAWPNAFGKREMSALQVLAGRIAESTREAQVGIPADTPEPESLAIAPAVATEPDAMPVAAAARPMSLISEEKPSMIWSVVLILLVIATAVTLGVVIGWRRAAKVPNGAAIKANSATASAVNAAADPPQAESAEPAASAAKTPARPAVPPGGLVVTENGKVVYRSAGGAQSSPSQAARSLIHRVEPEYPSDAKAQRVQGSVVLDVQVLGTGGVGNIGVISGDPLLTQAAVDAVKQWRYQSDIVNGQGVDSQLRVTVKFSLPPG